MSTSHQRISARRPFGSVNANTIRGGFGKSTSGAVKPEKKSRGLLSRRGLFTSILTNTKKAGKAERSGRDETLKLESPTKKARVIRENEEPSTQITSNARAGDYDAIFRRSAYLKAESSNNFWSDEMEEMLSLRPSRPVNDSRDDDETSLDVEVDELEERDGCDFYEQVRSALVKELSVDDTSSAEHIVALNHGHLKEHETDGVQIEFHK
jgi:hypothetical protein